LNRFIICVHNKMIENASVGTSVSTKKAIELCVHFIEHTAKNVQNRYAYLYFLVRVLSRDITDGFHFDEQNSKEFFLLNITSFMPCSTKYLSVSDKDLQQFYEFFLLGFDEDLCSNLFHDVVLVRKNMEQTISKSVADDVDFLLNCSVNVSSF